MNQALLKVEASKSLGKEYPPEESIKNWMNSDFKTAINSVDVSKEKDHDGDEIKPYRRFDL